MVGTTPPNMGLLGFLFEADPDVLIEAETICELAEEIQFRIMKAFAQMKICPEKAIEIDGERWAPEKVWKALQDLYDWTVRVCSHSEGSAVAIVGRGAICGRNTLC